MRSSVAVLLRAWVLGSVVLCSVFCGGENQSADNTRTMEFSGSLGIDDRTDPDFCGRIYQSYRFSARPMDSVAIIVDEADFDPLLMLKEVSTGAELAQWDPEYSGQPGLTYRIAGPGEYEARIYSRNDSLGSYSVVITVDGR